MTLKYLSVGGTSYHPETPPDLISVLEDCRRRIIRLRFFYEDGSTLEGYIGRRYGTVRLPLAVKTKRSLGGSVLEPERIVKIETTRQPRVLWQKGGSF